MRSLRYGCSRTRSSSARRQLAALVPDRVRHAEPAEIVHERGAAQQSSPRSGQPELARRLGASSATPRAVTHRPRRLQLGELADRRERVVELLVAEHVAPSDGSASITSSQLGRRVELGEAASAPARRTARPAPGRTACRCAPAPRRPPPRRRRVRRNTSTTSARLISREREPICSPLQPVGALPVPALVALPQALAHVVAQAKPRRQLVGGQVVVLGQAHAARAGRHPGTRRRPGPARRSGRPAPPTFFSMNAAAWPALDRSRTRSARRASPTGRRRTTSPAHTHPCGSPPRRAAPSSTRPRARLLEPSRSASRSAIRHARTMCSIGWPSPDRSPATAARRARPGEPAEPPLPTRSSLGRRAAQKKPPTALASRYDSAKG